MMAYQARAAHLRPDLQGDWDSPAWQQADIADIAHFRPESSHHRPTAQARLLYDEAALYGIFRVEDRYVRSVQTAYQGPVYTDSCVELFVQPKPGAGYFNFEFNCGGTLLCSYITQPRVESAIHRLSPEEGRRVRIYHSMPPVVEPEIQQPTTWVIEYAIPLDLLSRYVGQLGKLARQTWRANFYKCGDHTSHPHWAAWSPVDRLDFHRPECFGNVVFTP